VSAHGSPAAQSLSRLPSGSPDFTANITNFEVYSLFPLHVQVSLQYVAKTSSRLRLKCDGTRAETRFRLLCETDESI